MHTHTALNHDDDLYTACIKLPAGICLGQLLVSFRCLRFLIERRYSFRAVCHLEKKVTDAANRLNYVLRHDLRCGMDAEDRYILAVSRCVVTCHSDKMTCVSKRLRGDHGLKRRVCHGVYVGAALPPLTKSDTQALLREASSVSVCMSC